MYVKLYLKNECLIFYDFFLFNKTKKRTETHLRSKKKKKEKKTKNKKLVEKKKKRNHISFLQGNIDRIRIPICTNITHYIPERKEKRLILLH